jgi:hypothetical protein
MAAIDLHFTGKDAGSRINSATATLAGQSRECKAQLITGDIGGQRPTKLCLCNIASGRNYIAKAPFSPPPNTGPPFPRHLTRSEGRRCCENGSPFARIGQHRLRSGAPCVRSRLQVLVRPAFLKYLPFPRRRFAATVLFGFLKGYDRAPLPASQAARRWPYAARPLGWQC